MAMQAASEIADDTYDSGVDTEYHAECVAGKMVEQLLAEDHITGPKYTPLAAAVRSGNPKLFRRVYDTVENYKRQWTPEMVSKSTV